MYKNRNLVYQGYTVFKFDIIMFWLLLICYGLQHPNIWIIHSRDETIKNTELLLHNRNSTLKADKEVFIWYLKKALNYEATGHQSFMISGMLRIYFTWNSMSKYFTCQEQTYVLKFSNSLDCRQCLKFIEMKIFMSSCLIYSVNTRSYISTYNI